MDDGARGKARAALLIHEAALQAEEAAGTGDKEESSVGEQHGLRRPQPQPGCGDRTATRAGVGPVAAIHPVPSGGKLGRHRGLSLSLGPLNNGRPWAGPALLLPGAQQAGICWQRTGGGRPQVRGGAGRLPGPSRQVPRGSKKQCGPHAHPREKAHCHDCAVGARYEPPWLLQQLRDTHDL